MSFPSNVDYGSLQASYDGTRSLLVASSTGVPAELDRTLAWLGADRKRWYSLSGDVLFTAVGRDPVALSLDTGTAAEPENTPVQGILTWVLLGVGALSVLGLGAAAMLLVWARRSRRLARAGSG